MKAKTIFYCTSCGNETLRWQGQCPACGAWNTIAEQPAAPKASKKGCALLEFDSYETALNIFKKYNGINHKNLNIKLNWVKTYNRLNEEKQVKFTV